MIQNGINVWKITKGYVQRKNQKKVFESGERKEKWSREVRLENRVHWIEERVSSE